MRSASPRCRRCLPSFRPCWLPLWRCDATERASHCWLRTLVNLSLSFVAQQTAFGRKFDFCATALSRSGLCTLVGRRTCFASLGLCLRRDIGIRRIDEAFYHRSARCFFRSSVDLQRALRPEKAPRVLVSLLLAFALSLSPWEIWANRVSGEYIPLCTNGPATLADGITFGGFRKGAHSHPQVPANVAALARDLASHREDLLTTGGIARLLLAKAKEQPINVAHLFLTKAVQSWYGNDSHTHEKWTALIQLFYLPLFAVGAGLAWLRGRQARNFLLIAGGVTIYYWAMTTVAALAIVRYMVPAIGVLMVLAADAADALVSAVAHWAGLGRRSKLSILTSAEER
jgi:hypothetical protein